MKQPDSRIIGLEPKHKVSVRSDEDCVTTHWDCRERHVIGVDALIVLRACDDLEMVLDRGYS